MAVFIFRFPQRHCIVKRQGATTGTGIKPAGVFSLDAVVSVDVHGLTEGIAAYPLLLGVGQPNSD